MAAPVLLRTLPLLRHSVLRSYHLFVVNVSTSRLPFCSAAVEPTAAADDNIPSRQKHSSVTTQEPPRYPWVNDSDFRKWKEQEAMILEDIEPIVCLTKEILHSDRYMDGERLIPEDEKAVRENILAHHPHSEDKIGCGLDSIMVDRHPQFRQSRCLFVVRTDGGWIDFSYQKCLRAYIRDKYPCYAERFIKEHFKRGSS